MSKANLKKDYIWNSIGVLCQNLISPLLLVVVARLNGVDDVGLFSFAFSLALVFWAISIWGARTYQVSDTKREFTHQSYVLVRVILSIFVLIGSVVFSVVNDYDLYKTSIIFALVLYKTLESIADAIYGILQVNEKLYQTGKSLLLKSVLGTLLFVVIDISTQNILLSSIGLLISNLIVLLAYDIPKAKKFNSVWPSLSSYLYTFRRAVVIIRRCAPIASVIFMSMFSLLIIRYFIDTYHNEEIGYFGILAMPITALGLLITFIIQPNIVQLSELFSKKRYKKFNRVVLSILFVTLVVSILILPIVFIFGVDLFEIIFGLDFSNYQIILLVFVFGAVLNAFVTIFINLLTIMRYFKIQFYTLVLTNIILLIACLKFIPENSLLGGVILYSLVNLLQLVFLTIAYHRAIVVDARSR